MQGKFLDPYTVSSTTTAYNTNLRFSTFSLLPPIHSRHFTRCWFYAHGTNSRCWRELPHRNHDTYTFLGGVAGDVAMKINKGIESNQRLGEQKILFEEVINLHMKYMSCPIKGHGERSES